MSYNASVNTETMPARVKALPVSPKGFPVPWFVAWIDAVPDFRVADQAKMRRAIKERRCWVCGGELGRMMAFPIGPMCAINRTISEPPSHRDCAIWSALNCPFLANPRMRRREAGLPEEIIPAAGHGLKRNPGSVAVWITRRYRPFQPPGGGVLFELGEPEEVLWFAEGRAATRDEVSASISSGLPALEEVARSESPQALNALVEAVRRSLPLLPAAVAA